MVDAKIIIDGKEYSGWKGVSIKRSMDTLCGTFSFSFTNPKISGGEFLIASPGSIVQVKDGDDLLITGYIDSLRAGLDDTSNNLNISGRDITSDIIDCSVSLQKPLNKVNFKTFLTALIADYGIEIDSGNLIFEESFKFTAEKGQRIWDAISNKAAEFGYLLTTTPDGKIKITNSAVNNITVSLIEGQNIERASYSIDNKERYQIYRVTGQGKTKSRGWRKGTAYNYEAVSIDSDIRFRQLIVGTSGTTTKKRIQNQADWENSTRKGFAESVGTTMTGWRKPDGKIWEINEIVFVSIPSYDIEKEMLIIETNFSQDDSGSFTDLVLVPPETFKRVA